jgi:hypothetical protein
MGASCSTHGEADIIRVWGGLDQSGSGYDSLW